MSRVPWRREDVRQHAGARLKREERSDGRKGWRSVRYTVIIESGRESGYVVLCPALPGCVSQGRTRRAALRNIKEAVEAYIQVVVPAHSIVDTGTLAAILQAAGLTVEDFEELL